ncbi:MAG TPA: hypothetical protein DEB32_05230, partial [Stenotrophomonas sp.]|nr:hypothetical protein [Stenotrophomonas sp.]
MGRHRGRPGARRRRRQRRPAAGHAMARRPPPGIERLQRPAGGAPGGGGWLRRLPAAACDRKASGHGIAAVRGPVMKGLVRLCLVLLWGHLVVPGAWAHTPDAVQVSMRQGLPSDRVYQIVEDRQGYRWFATSDGLARHDGRRFRLWRIEQGLPDNDITSVALDAQDQLWAGTASGHLLHLSADGRHLRRVEGARALAASAITTLLPLPDGSLWFGTRDAGLYRRTADGRLQRFLPGPAGAGLPSPRVRALARGADGTVWIGTAGGLAR